MHDNASAIEVVNLAGLGYWPVPFIECLIENAQMETNLFQGIETSAQRFSRQRQQLIWIEYHFNGNSCKVTSEFIYHMYYLYITYMGLKKKCRIDKNHSKNYDAIYFLRFFYQCSKIKDILAKVPQFWLVYYIEVHYIFFQPKIFCYFIV